MVVGFAIVICPTYLCRCPTCADLHVTPTPNIAMDQKTSSSINLDTKEPERANDVVLPLAAIKQKTGSDRRLAVGAGSRASPDP